MLGRVEKNAKKGQKSVKNIFFVRYVNISWCTQPTTLLINQWGGRLCTSEVSFTSSIPFSITVHKQNCCTVVQSLRCRVTQKLWDTNGTGLSLQRKITKIITCSHPCSLYFEGNPICTVYTTDTLYVHAVYTRKLYMYRLQCTLKKPYMYSVH